MPQVKFLVDSSPLEQPWLFGDACRSLGYDILMMRYRPFDATQGYEYLERYSPNDCVVFFGSLNMARDLQRKTPWIPGPWCNFENFKCGTYFAYFGKYLWNQNYTILPWAEFMRRWDKDPEPDLLSMPEVFIRPDDGFKSFAGQALSYNDKSSIKYLENRVRPETLCVVAPAREPFIEWRVFVDGVNKRVITGSQYKYEGDFNLETTVISGIPNYVEAYVQRILNEVDWYPDKLYVMDICSDRDGHLALLELNSFSCSGQYASNQKAIIQAAAEMAEKEWKEINDI
jgi:hypothetical protein